MADFSYLASVLDDRKVVEWFTDAPAAGDAVAGPLDVYLRTTEGDVTWGWAIEPFPLDTGGRAFRRLRRPEADWILLVDAEEPELVSLDSSVDVHVVRTDDRTTAAVALPSGAVPDLGDAIDLARATREPGATYLLTQGWRPAAVSDALSLWTAAFLDREIEFTAVSPSPDDLDAVAALIGDAPDDGPEVTDEPVGYDDEIDDIIGGWEAVAWIQGDLTWPDVDDHEAFRDRIDVRFRDEDGTPTWLVAVEPPDPADEALVWWELDDGGVVGLDPADAGRVALPHDRLVLALSVPDTGFEPAGVSVPLGTAPSSEQWDELRRVSGEHETAVLIHAPAWSEQRVSAALTAWALAWTGQEIEFAYDFDDEIPQATIEANNALADAPPPQRTIRTDRPSFCMYVAPPVSPLEDPLPCGRPGTHYFAEGDQVVVVCEEHIPPDRTVSALLRA